MPAEGPSARRSPLDGELIRLRALTEADAEPLNPKFSDLDVLLGLGKIPFPQSLDGFREFVRRQSEDDTQIHLVIETLDGCPIGICGLMDLDRHSRQGKAGIWIARDHWNAGAGTDAMRTLCRWGFGELNLHRIWLLVHSTNPRAIRAYEKVGFVKEGTQRDDHFIDGRFIDTHVMGLLEHESDG
ncbi:MAG: GNAT family protein [Actinomycetota bacterium]